MSLSSIANEELGDCISIGLDLLKQAMTAVKSESEEEAEIVFKNKKKMNKAEKKFNKSHLTRIKNRQCNPGMTACFSGILYNLERAADNCVSIAEEALDHPGFIDLGEKAGKFETAVIAETV